MPFYVYLLASRRHGTGDLVRRVHEHKSHDALGFSARYGVDRLVWFEVYDNPTDAIAREKALSGGEIGRSD